MSEIKFDKSTNPTFEEMLSYSGKAGKFWLELENYLIKNLGAGKNLDLPWSGKDGWAVRYKLKSKQIGDIYPEQEAIILELRIREDAIEPALSKLNKDTLSAWENGYPCKVGGAKGRWIDITITNSEQLEDAKKIINAKMGVKN